VRALVVLAELWAGSEIILLASPQRSDALPYAFLAAFLLGCCALTFVVTYPRRGERDAPATRRLLPLQLAVVLVIVAATGWSIAARAHELAPALPLWASADRHLLALLDAFSPRGLGAAFTAFAECAVLPLVALVLLRVPLRSMGLGGFAKGSASAAAIWLVVPFFALAYVVLYADTSLALVARRLLYGFFATGFSEEFLFRGALFGRLRSVMPAQWAALTQAIVFGLWHVGSDVARTHNAITALALVVPAQAAFGYAMALLVRRSGNLAVPAIFHTAVDAIRALAF
jgi:membrane protease YdiL (CAAX protease family)